MARTSLQYDTSSFTSTVASKLTGPVNYQVKNNVKKNCYFDTWFNRLHLLRFEYLQSLEKQKFFWIRFELAGLDELLGRKYCQEKKSIF